MKYEQNNDIDECVLNYFNVLKGIKPLKKEEEHKLLLQYKLENNLKARDVLIMSNLKYACKLASGFRGRGISYYDLISEANCGLMEAIDKFDITKDVKIISYAKWNIIQKMQIAVEECNKFKESDLPTDNEAQLDCGDNDDVATKQNVQEMSDVYIDEEPEENKEQELFIDKIFNGLSEREKIMIDMYYGRNCDKEYTLEEIGDKFGLTKERVRQIIEIAFRKIRSEAILVDSQYLSR